VRGDDHPQIMSLPSLGLEPTPEVAIKTKRVEPTSKKKVPRLDR
jgi:hypothetical protein